VASSWHVSPHQRCWVWSESATIHGPSNTPLSASSVGGIFELCSRCWRLARTSGRSWPFGGQCR